MSAAPDTAQRHPSKPRASSKDRQRMAWAPGGQLPSTGKWRVWAAEDRPGSQAGSQRRVRSVQRRREKLPAHPARGSAMLPWAAHLIRLEW